jgi:hypothetical protein
MLFLRTALISKATAQGISVLELNLQTVKKWGCLENRLLTARQESHKLRSSQVGRTRQHSTLPVFNSVHRQRSEFDALQRSKLIVMNIHRSYSNQGTKSEWATSSVLKKGCLYFLVATGAAVWALQLVELLAAWVAPDEYASFMGFDTEEEEERRTQRFYGVPPHLGDDAYFVELAARHAALKELLFRMEASPSILGILGSSRAKDPNDGAGPDDAVPTPASGLEMVFLTDTARLAPPNMDGAEPREVWRPRMYLEGPARAVLATATFERPVPPLAPRRRGGDGGDPARGWVPVALIMEAVGEAPAASRLLLDSRAPLPHGIRYSALRARDGDYDA